MDSDENRMRQKKFYDNKKLKSNVKSDGERLLDMILEYELDHTRCHLVRTTPLAIAGITHVLMRYLGLEG